MPAWARYGLSRTPEGDSRALFEAIRRSRNLRSWKQVAALAGISQSHLSGLVRGKEFTEHTHERLRTAFPEYEDQLASLMERQRQAAADPDAEILRRIHLLVDRSRHTEARDQLVGLVTRDGLPAAITIDAHAMLAMYDLDAGDVDTGAEHMQTAIAAALRIGDTAWANLLTERLAQQLTRLEHYERAINLVSAALATQLTTTDLWRRLGVVRWYAGDLLGAYAVLTTALSLGHRRLHIIHARGQVLAELGAGVIAITELNEAVDGASSPLSRAYARSSRAWAIATTGDVDSALREFHIAEADCPHNAWLHYFRARCYDEYTADREAALSGYRAALRLDGPALNQPKRVHALQRIELITTG